MRKWLLLILGVLTFQVGFSQGNIIWPESDSELNTGSNATVAVQASNFSNITLEGYDSIPAGAYIGVFYTDGLSYDCGGFTQWPDSTVNFVFPAWQNEYGSGQNGFLLMIRIYGF